MQLVFSLSHNSSTGDEHVVQWVPARPLEQQVTEGIAVLLATDCGQQHVLYRGVDFRGYVVIKL